MRYAVAILVAMAISTAAEGAIIGRIHRFRTVAVSKTVVVSQASYAQVRTTCRAGACGLR